MVAFFLLTSIVALLAESLHLRRCARLSSVLFGGARPPWPTLLALMTLRISGFSLVAFGAAQLWQDSKLPAQLNSAYDQEETDRLLILLDASLSMNIQDAGPTGDQSRGTRAADIIRELVLSEDRPPPRTTLIVFADEHYPLIVDTNDWRVIQTSLNNRHLSEVLFDDEKTTLGAVLNEVAVAFAQKWPDDSAALLLLTDGDSDDKPSRVNLPRSIRRSVIAGFGSAEGRMIGNFRSKRGDEILQATAQALGGSYYNANATAVPAEALGRPVLTPEEPDGSTQADSKAPAPIPTRETWPLMLLLVGSILLLCAVVLARLLDPNSNSQTLAHEKAVFLS